MSLVTIKTDLFDNFSWKKLPLEHDYVNIVFCINKFKNIFALINGY